MKRYLLFMGNRYYPSGGMGDFRGDFDSEDEAIASIVDEIRTDLLYTAWGHIWDSHGGPKAIRDLEPEIKEISDKVWAT